MIDEGLKTKLLKYNQNYILASLERMTGEDKEKLINQLLNIDFEEMENLYSLTKGVTVEKDEIIEPMKHEDITKLDIDTKQKYVKIGEEIIKSNKFAVVTMAGGQGTRLGHNGPKGTFDMGLDSHKSLFEIFSDKLNCASKKYDAKINWYIMTSKENNGETIRFFEDKNYFGYGKELVTKFFEQRQLPMLDENGKILINENGFVKEAANGHGGVFEAMFINGVLDDMKKKGVEWIFICGVDNPLVNMVDPLFIGFSAANKYIASSKTLEKAYPKEKVGAFCKKNGSPYVMEYTEISDELANLRNNDGELVYGESHVLLNLYNIVALEKIKEAKLPYHVAHKKSNYMDVDGRIVIAEKPNAYKFETFLFDGFSLLPDVGLLRGIRENDFAPIKNATGDDSPETARKLYLDYEKRLKEGE